LFSDTSVGRNGSSNATPSAVNNILVFITYRLMVNKSVVYLDC
jgi:hypothetical protein